MVRACRRAGVRVVLVPSAFDPERIPRPGMKIGRRTIPAAEFERILDAFRSTQAQVAKREKVTLAHHRLERADAETRRYFLDPVHLDGEGNRLVAEDLISALADLGALAAAAGER
jgi:lysophospholipase L1-like esterase